MALEQYENNYSTLLNGSVNNSVTTLTVDAAPLTMTANFRIRIDDEIILVGAVSGLTFTGCTRGVEGTTAASHSDNAIVEHILTDTGLENAGELVLLGPYRRTAGNYTISSATFANIDGTNLSFTFTPTRARRYKMCTISHVLGGATANQQIWLDVVVDGTPQGGATGLVAFRNANDTTQRRYNGSFTYLTDVLSVASHTLSFTWAAATGTATIVGDGTNSTAEWWIEETTFRT